MTLATRSICVSPGCCSGSCSSGRRRRQRPAAYCRPAHSSIDLGCGGPHADARAGVVHVTLGVLQRRVVLWLGGLRRVPGTDEDLVLPGREFEGNPPLSPGPPAEVLKQLRLRPARATVDRDVDPRDMPLPTGERVPRTSTGPAATVSRRPETTCRSSARPGRAASPHPDRACRPAATADRRRAGNTLPGPRADRDPLEPLDAPGADIAGHHHAQRRAVDEREWLSIHPPCEQDLGTTSLVERDRAAEASAGVASRQTSPPPKPTSVAPGNGPAGASTSASPTPVHVAVPVAPAPHGSSHGMSRMAIRPVRRLPAHCSVAVTSCSRNASCKVTRERSSSRSTSPSTRSRHASGSISGTAACDRT